MPATHNIVKARASTLFSNAPAHTDESNEKKTGCALFFIIVRQFTLFILQVGLGLPVSMPVDTKWHWQVSELRKKFVKKL
jgi:hypothetical protein